MYGICNVVGASIPRNTDSGTYIHVGPEIGVASTKAFTGQVTVLMLLALCVGQMRGTVDDATVERIVRELKNMPLYIKDVLGLADKIKNLSKIYTYARNFLYLGRGYNYPTALEGALKLKEISYIHAEGYPAAEMKHGPIALVDSEMPTVVIAPTDSLYDKIISNVRQVKARGGTVVAIITKGNDAMKDIADHCLEVPDVPECLTPSLKVVSMAFLLPSKDDAVVWRGPVKMTAIRQFIEDVEWGDLDYLVVDMPPGTGDEAISIIQLIPKADGMVIVTTPQDVALLDSRKSITFSAQANIPIIGLIENMSGFICPHCGEKTDIFKSGGGLATAKNLNIQFLGAVPIEPKIVMSSDSGMPIVIDDPDSASAKIFKEITKKIIKTVE